MPKSWLVLAKSGAGIKRGVGYLVFRTKDAEGLFHRKSEDLSLLLDPEAEGGLEAADEEPVNVVGQRDKAATLG